ncbi:protein of unknown function [Candidatus Filomicrobium marinum]|uniref:Uncharacterized protein n=1 Tax=Candidatus Filomicrobium marinum TaxID=1608628 RepID=A0A0D6JJH6_9HYPH|nr:protein of unknown function [Candidatus Filomicrobium marinum]CPR21857.1 protein of unknown function [Candidatus Filomicrobium marinum]
MGAEARARATATVARAASEGARAAQSQRLAPHGGPLPNPPAVPNVNERALDYGSCSGPKAAQARAATPPWAWVLPKPLATMRRAAPQFLWVFPLPIFPFCFDPERCLGGMQ